MSPSMNGFRQFRDECSRIIEDLGMEIKSVNDEVTGTVWVVLVSICRLCPGELRRVDSRSIPTLRE